MKIKSGPRSLAGWGSLIFGVGCRLEASAKRPLIVFRALQLAPTRAAPNRRSFGPWLGRGQIGAAALLAVGAAFDFHAGRKRRAPRWMQRTGTEWLFRLLTEPRRLVGRYTVVNARFLWLVLKDELRRRYNRA